ncbi:NHS-like protein 3 isoform X2 [Mobula birostris]|uniref:NHS-like protein 3 isoform X2 n=1 Tax=Mobula birostris TaxID=1983395 RepID=UPI003B281704
MGNTHHKKKVAHCSKPRPLWYFGRSRPDKQRKDTSKSDDETNFALHFRPSLYQHRQENVFQPASRPAHIEDLHKEAEFGLRSLQEQVSGSPDGGSELQLGNGQDSMDDCSQTSQDEDLPDLPDSASGGPGDEVWTKTRSLPPPTPDEIRRNALVSQPTVSSTGATFKPQKTQSSFKGPKLKEKRIRRTTIMGLPQHIQQELGLGKGPRPSKADGIDHSDHTLVSRGDENHYFNNLSHSRVRSSMRSVTFSDPSRQDNESTSTLGLHYLHNWTLMDSPDRPRSLAAPKSSVPSELLQSPVMSMSPQATYLSKIIPNAILPPTVDVVMISNSQNCLRRLSNSGVLCAPSPACSRAVSLQNYDGRDCASSDAWSNSQSSETIVSNNSTISSQGNTRTVLNNHSTETDGEKVRVDHNLTNTPLDHRANTSRWVSECTAPSSVPEAESPSARLNTSSKPTELCSNGYANQSLSPAHSTCSITDTSDTQSITSERSITRSLSVRKMKKPPAPPRRMHSLHHEEEQDSEPRARGPSQTSSSRLELSPAGGNDENPALCQRLVPAHNEPSSGKSLPPQDTSSASQSEPTTSSPTGSLTPVRVLVPPPSPTGESRPGAPGRSISASSVPSLSPDSKYAHLFVIPPPPSTPAPPPPNVKPFKVPAVPYPWAREAIPPPPPGPAPLPPTKRPSFLFNIPALGSSRPHSPQVPLHARGTPLVTAPACTTPLVTASADSTTSLAIISTPTTTPLVTSSTSAVTALGTTSAPTSTSLVSASEPTTAPLVTTSASTVTSLVSASEPSTTPLINASEATTTLLVTTSAPTVNTLVTTPAPTTTPLATVSDPTTTPLVTTSVPSTTSLVTASEPTTTPMITTSAATLAPLVTIPSPNLTLLVTASEPTVTPPVSTSGAPIVTGSLASGLLASASGPSAALTTSISTSASSSTTEQVQIGVIPLKVKQLSPPSSPPPSHNPPPPPEKPDTEQPSVPTPSTKLEQPPVDWPPPPPPLSPGEVLPVVEGAAAEFLFPPPPPSLLEDAAERNRSPEDEHWAGVSAPLPPSAPVGVSPPPPPLLPAGTTTSSPKPLTLTPSSVTKQLQPKTQDVEGAASRFPNTGPPPSAPSQDSAKGQVVSPPPQAGTDEQTSAPIVTPSLLQMVRLRSVQMNASAVAMPDSNLQMNRSQDDAKQPNKSNMTPPSKPARKSLSQRLSSSSDSEPAVSANVPLPVKTPPHSTGGAAAQGHALLRPGDNETPLKSPASTASFIFSKNVSPKKLVFETPRSLEAEAEAKRNFMAELASVSGRIASKTESRSSSGPTAKAVAEAQKKAGRVPPPVAKKPSFLPGSQRLPSTSTKETDAQETSQTLQVTGDVQEEKGEVKTGNGEVSLCKGD